MISKKHIAENQAVIAELTSRCVDKDEEIARLKELAAHWERGHKDLYAYSEEEIARLKALCREPVVLNTGDVDIPEWIYEYDWVVLTLTAVNKKLEQRK